MSGNTSKNYLDLTKDELLQLDPHVLNQLRHQLGDQEFIDQWKLTQEEYSYLINGIEEPEIIHMSQPVNEVPQARPVSKGEPIAPAPAQPAPAQPQAPVKPVTPTKPITPAQPAPAQIQPQAPVKPVTPTPTPAAKQVTPAQPANNSNLSPREVLYPTRRAGPTTIQPTIYIDEPVVVKTQPTK
jgi:hypothetical protein